MPEKRDPTIRELADLGLANDGRDAFNRQSLQNDVKAGLGPLWRQALMLATKTFVMLTSFSVDVRWSLLGVAVHWLKWDLQDGASGDEVFYGFAIVWRTRPIVSYKRYVSWALLEFLLNRRDSWRKEER